MKKFLIDRNELPYDAMVADERCLYPVEIDEESEAENDEETQKLQTDEVHGRDFSL